MQRREFIQGALASVAGAALAGSFLIASLPAGTSSIDMRIIRRLRQLGLYDNLESLGARVVGGAVSAFACGDALPAVVQVVVPEPRFDHAWAILQSTRSVKLELWSDRFSCRRTAEAHAPFSSFNYWARVDSGFPQALFRHQSVAFDVRRQTLHDPSGWLSSSDPRLELSSAAPRGGWNTAAKREVVALADAEQIAFRIRPGEEFEFWRHEIALDHGVEVAPCDGDFSESSLGI